MAKYACLDCEGKYSITKRQRADKAAGNKFISRVKCPCGGELRRIRVLHGNLFDKYHNIKTVRLIA